MSIWTSAADELTRYLAERELQKREALKERLLIQDRHDRRESERRNQERADENLKLSQAAEARAAAAQRAAEEQKRELQDYKEAAQLYEHMPAGPSDQATFDKLQRNQMNMGIIDKTPGLSMPLMRLAPEQREGDIPLLPTPINRLQVTPDQFQSRGGTRVQAAAALAAEKEESNRQRAQERADAREDQQAFVAAQNEQNRLNRLETAAMGNQVAMATLGLRQDEARRELAAADRKIEQGIHTANDAIDLAKDLLSDPEASNYFGRLETRHLWKQGTIDYGKKVERFQNLLTKDGIEALRGLGPMAILEMRMIQSSVAALHRMGSPELAAQEYVRLIDVLNRNKQLAIKSANGRVQDVVAPPSDKPKNSPYLPDNFFDK